MSRKKCDKDSNSVIIKDSSDAALNTLLRRQNLVVSPPQTVEVPASTISTSAPVANVTVLGNCCETPCGSSGGGGAVTGEVKILDCEGNCISEDNPLQVNVVGSSPSEVKILDCEGNCISEDNPLQVNVVGSTGGETKILDCDGECISDSNPLAVNVVTGGTSGVQYTEGDADASVTGTAVMWKDSFDILHTATPTTPLPVDLNFVNGGVIATGNGNVSTETIRVAIAANNSPVPTGLDYVGGFAVQTTAAGVQLVGISGSEGTVLDSTSSKLDVNLAFVNGGVIATGNGNVSTETIRVAIAANNSPVPTGLDYVGGFAVQTISPGIQLVGIAGSSGVVLDSTANKLDVNLAYVNGGVIATGNGNVSTETIRVAIAANNSPVPTGLDYVGGFAVQTTAAGVQLVGISGSEGTVLDSTSSKLDVNLAFVNGGAIATGNGNVSTETIRVAIAANNSPVPTGLDYVGGFAVQTTAAGIQLVGISGSSGVVLDSTANKLDVNLAYVNGGVIATGNGNVSTETIRVAIAANNSPVPTGIDYVGGFAVQTSRAGVQLVGLAEGVGGTALTAHAVGGAEALDVAIVDGSGNQITTFSGTQYTEDAAAAANPVGTAVNLVRQDTPAGLVSNDGDNVTQRGTNYGAAYVQVLNSSGSFIDTFGGNPGATLVTQTTGVDFGNAIDCTGYRYVAVQITGTWSGSFHLQGSNSSSTDFLDIGFQDRSGLSESGNIFLFPAQTSQAIPLIFTASISTKYIRAQGLTGANAKFYLSAQPVPPDVLSTRIFPYELAASGNLVADADSVVLSTATGGIGTHADDGSNYYGVLSGSVLIKGTWSGSLEVQASNDFVGGVAWQTCALYDFQGNRHTGDQITVSDVPFCFNLPPGTLQVRVYANTCTGTAEAQLYASTSHGNLGLNVNLDPSNSAVKLYAEGDIVSNSNPLAVALFADVTLTDGAQIFVNPQQDSGSGTLDMTSGASEYENIFYGRFIAVQIYGTWTGTIGFKTNFTGNAAQDVDIYGTNISTGAVSVSTTASGIFQFETACFNKIRLVVSATGTGTANLIFIGSGI